MIKLRELILCSTKGNGNFGPAEKSYKKLEGMNVPCGKGEKIKLAKALPVSIGGEYSFNEYIVYDTAQIKMEYLIFYQN